MKKHYKKKSLSACELWLLRYQDAIAEERLLVNRIDSIDSRAKSTTRRITGMPKGDPDDAVPALSDERSNLKAMVPRVQAIKLEILEVINQLPNDERRLLTAYFIEGKSLEKAAEFVPCSVRTAVDMKKRALKRIANAK